MTLLNIGDLIRAKLDSGTLPDQAPGKMFAGYGNDRSCSACETPILRSQVEYEFDTPGGVTIRFHLGCAGAWEAERRRRGSSRPPNRQSPGGGRLRRYKLVTVHGQSPCAGSR